MKTVAAVVLISCALAGADSTRARLGASPVEATACDPNAKAATLDFTMKNSQDKPVRLADYKGKLVVLNFWATWCIPCRAEIPALVELQAKYARQGLQVIGVSIDDPVEKMQPFVSQYKVNYPAVTAFKNEAILDAFGPLIVVPATFVIRRDGKICMRHIGPVTKEKFEQEIKGLL
jgi:peroxiredoxin